MVKMKNTIRFIFVVLSLGNIGVSSLTTFPISNKNNKFHHILQDECNTYVDKTDLLEIILSPKCEEQILVITMPRGFGKTTNLGMIQKFCEIEMSNDGTPVAKDLDNISNTPNYHLFTKKYSFGHLKISENEEFIREHLGKYPVAYFNFKGCGQMEANKEAAVLCIANSIHEAFLLHPYLLNLEVNVSKKSNPVNLEPKKRRSKKSKRNDLDENEIESWMSSSGYGFKTPYKINMGVQLLLRLLQTFHKKRVILLVDEYDAVANCVMRRLLPKNELEDILGFYYSTFYNALKDEGTSQLALFTGVVHISDDGVSFNGILQDVKMFPFARNQKFVKYYGFTRNEVEELFNRHGNEIENLSFEDMKRYYDGYRAFEEEIYSPFSIINCLKEKKIDAYWAQAASIQFIWPALNLFRIRIIVIELCEGLSVILENLDKICLQSIINLQNCLNSEIPKYGDDEEINAFLDLLLDAGYFKINSSNHTHSNVSLANEETLLDLNHLLNTYTKETKDNEMGRLETAIVVLLKSFKYDNFEVEIQDFTNLWNQLVKIYLPTVPNYKEEDLKNTLKCVCSRLRLNFYSEAKVNQTKYTIPKLQFTGATRNKDNPDIPTTPLKPITTQEITLKDNKGNPRIGFVDYIFTEIPGVLIIVKTKYSAYGTSQTALQQIKDKYLGGVLESEHYNKTPPYDILLLGVHLSGKKPDLCIKISATIIPDIKLHQFGEVKTINCAPRTKEIIKTDIAPLKRKRRPK